MTTSTNPFRRAYHMNGTRSSQKSLENLFNSKDQVKPDNTLETGANVTKASEITAQTDKEPLASLSIRKDKHDGEEDDKRKEVKRLGMQSCHVRQQQTTYSILSQTKSVDEAESHSEMDIHTNKLAFVENDIALGGNNNDDDDDDDDDINEDGGGDKAEEADNSMDDENENMGLRLRLNTVVTRRSTPTTTDATPIQREEKKDDRTQTHQRQRVNTLRTPSPRHKRKASGQHHTYHAYIWFWNRSDALRCQERFDNRSTFGSSRPIRFLPMRDMTQKVYVSGLKETTGTREDKEREIETAIEAKLSKETELWRKRCIVTYWNNGHKPFAYLRFPSATAAQQAIDLFHQRPAFGNPEGEPISLEAVVEDTDLLSHKIGRRFNHKMFWMTLLKFIFLPMVLVGQWVRFLCKEKEQVQFLQSVLDAKQMTQHDLLAALFFCHNKCKNTLLTRSWYSFLLRGGIILVITLLYTTMFRYWCGKLFGEDYANRDVLSIIYFALLSLTFSCFDIETNKYT
ncbi:hypothetical protein RFI_14086 [Reticulomyxa filosa]|uniref:RRM domain-containing protein n=1 Tax=Reticulomyxa filosa TaxID=46433 RepID=X6NBF0_RETFI|nr:hypothetical protein RFI_14086 [Reticulomyxa filosa]|eukprot:ETO23099.1 hypothetical protein RFI_14086 [Reticulomyxa filosa]